MEPLKKCAGCEMEKPVSEFWKQNGSPTGIVCRCKTCCKEQSARYYQTHRQKRIERARITRVERAAIISAQRKVAYRRQRETNLDTFREKRRAYLNRRLREDVPFRILAACRNRLYYVLRGTTKVGRTVELLGCTPEELKVHIEKQFQPGWTWEDWGKLFEVDHIKPCVTFDMSDAAQQRACFHYTNLRPLLKSENRAWRGRLEAA